MHHKPQSQTKSINQRAVSMDAKKSLINFNISYDNVVHKRNYKTVIQNNTGHI